MNTTSLGKNLLYACVIRAKLELFYRQPHTVLFYLYPSIHRLFSRSRDVTFVSYPKSGRTWIEQLLTKVAQLKYGITNPPIEQYKQISRIRSGVPIIEFTHAGSSWEGFPIYDGGELLKISPENYATGKVVFLYRDPRDVLVSSFYHLKYRTKVRGITPSAMITSSLFGLRKVLHFMNIWHSFCVDGERCLSISYEDLHRETLNQLRRVCQFIGLRAHEEILSQAVDECKFEIMKRKEKESLYRSPRLSAADADNPNSYKVRSGKIGQYLTFFSEQEVAHINSIIAEELNADFPYGRA